MGTANTSPTTSDRYRAFSLKCLRAFPQHFLCLVCRSPAHEAGVPSQAGSRRVTEHSEMFSQTPTGLVSIQLSHEVLGSQEATP